jgi:proteic killer suppression protein
MAAEIKLGMAWTSRFQRMELRLSNPCISGLQQPLGSARRACPLVRAECGEKETRKIAKNGNLRLDGLSRSGHGLVVIRSFGDKQTEKVYQGDRSRTLPTDIQSRANMKLFRIDQASQLEQLRLPPSNRLESLTGNLQGFWSIRINQQ